MKRLLVALLMIASSTLAVAQTANGKGSKTPEQRADGYANRLEKQLSLAADQKLKVHDLALERARRMDGLREKYKGQDKKVWQAERKQVQTDFHNGMKSTLSADQYLKWIEQQKKHAKNKAKGKAKNAGLPTGTGNTSDPDDGKELDGE